jgi:hypothetical protein
VALTLRFFICFALLAGAVGLGCSTGPPEPKPAVVDFAAGPAAQTKARVRQFKGDVKIKRAAGDDWLPATAALELFENDKVRTAAGASAQIDFMNGSVANIGEDALLSIAETQPRPGQERTDLTLLKGRLAAELEDPGKQSLTVSTPSATVRAGREIVFQ